MAKTKRKTTRGKRHRFEFTTAGLMSLGLFALMILVWIFIFGVLVGRGYRPEVLIPQLSKVLPQAERAPAPLPAPPPPEAQRHQVLKPEELDFSETLQSGTPPPAPETRPAPAKTAANPGQIALQPPPAKIDQPATGQRYAFVYQVASFKSAGQARAQRDLLRDRGLDASLTRAQVGSETWHRVEISFTGTEEQALTFKDRLAKMGIAESFLRSKKPL